MNSGRTVLAQLIEHLPHKEFHKCVARYRGNRYAKNFSCWILNASQAVLASFLCVSTKAIQAWEQGIRRPQSTALRAA
jgi:Domain of unknown function (DUF4372)